MLLKAPKAPVAGLRAPAVVDCGAKYAVVPDYPTVAAANGYYGKIY
jgi:hypothetical protein